MGTIQRPHSDTRFVKDKTYCRRIIKDTALINLHMQKPIISPDGKSRWNGVSWEPIQQKAVGGVDFQPKKFENNAAMPNNLQAPVIVYSQSNNNLSKFLFWGIGIVVIIALLIVLSGVLYVWASSLAGEGESVTVTKFEVTSPTLFGDASGCSEATILEYGEYFACEVSLNRDADIEIALELGSSEGLVHIYTMTKLNFEKFENGNEFLYIEDLSALSVNSVDLEGSLKESNYVFVVYNYGD